MANIHIGLQGKGGVGKSMILSMVYQGAKAEGINVIAFDTDPVNATLASYQEFNVIQIDLLAPDGNIDTRKFDVLLQYLADAEPDSHIIIDNGASSFVALGSYLQENDVIELLESLGHRVLLHTVITGGQALTDTINGFVNLVEAFPNSPLYVWLNPFFGNIEMDGKPFTEFNSYKEYGKNVKALIELPIGNRSLIGKDLEELFAKRQSFNVGINNSKYIAVRSRLKRYWTHVQELMKGAEIY